MFTRRILIYQKKIKKNRDKSLGKAWGEMMTCSCGPQTLTSSEGPINQEPKCVITILENEAEPHVEHSV